VTELSNPVGGSGGVPPTTAPLLAAAEATKRPPAPTANAEKHCHDLPDGHRLGHHADDTRTTVAD
jgi:hypothetical protein